MKSSAPAFPNPNSICWNVGGVDLIVPVYKNISLVRRCIDSIRRNNHEISAHHPRLIVVNDSPDDREVTKYLKQAAARQEIDHLIENEQNVGFVKSVNKALHESRKRNASAILINSDTETFPNTLSELISVADLDDQFAFVSPRSNNASVCTFPWPPYALSGRSMIPDEAHSVWRGLKDLLPRYSYSPTAIGFYLLIKSVIIKNFGGLDERFGAGYEEENDLISRAGKVGFRAILANHGFAFHAGSASFSLTDIALDQHKSANFEVLDARHPEFMPNVRSFERSAELRAERLLKGLLPDASGAIDVAIVLYSMVRAHNDTNEFIVNAVKNFVENSDNKFNVTIICDPMTAKFHGLDQFDRVRITPRIDQLYGIAINFSQPDEWHIVDIMESLAPIVVNGVLDVFSLDCAPLRHLDNVDQVWEYLAETSNALIFLSGHSQDTFKRRYPNHTAETFTRLIPMKQNGHATHASTKADERHVLIAGNDMSPSDTGRAGKLLANAFPALNFLIIGPQGVYPPNARVIRAGAAGDVEMAQAISDSRIIVLPSFNEGSGSFLMHSLASGKPVVARDIPATREMLRRFDGIEGVYLFADDQELETLLSESLNYRQVFSNRETEDDWSQWAKHFIAFLEKLLADRSKVYPAAVGRIKRGDGLRSKKIVTSHRFNSAVPVTEAGIEESLVIKWRDLMALPLGEFVDQAYEAILGRRADPEGRIYHLNRLGMDLTRAELIAAFLENDEFKSNKRRVQVDGLPSA